MWRCSRHYQPGFDTNQWTITRHNVWIKGLELMQEAATGPVKWKQRSRRSHVCLCVCVSSLCACVTVCCSIARGVFLLRYFSLTHKGINAFPLAVLILALPQQLPCIRIFGQQCPFDSVNCVLRNRTSPWPTWCRCDLRSCFFVNPSVVLSPLWCLEMARGHRSWSYVEFVLPADSLRCQVCFYGHCSKNKLMLLCEP